MVQFKPHPSLKYIHKRFVTGEFRPKTTPDWVPCDDPALEAKAADFISDLICIYITIINMNFHELSEVGIGSD